MIPKETALHRYIYENLINICLNKLVTKNNDEEKKLNQFCYVLVIIIFQNRIFQIIYTKYLLSLNINFFN